MLLIHASVVDGDTGEYVMPFYVFGEGELAPQGNLSLSTARPKVSRRENQTFVKAVVFFCDSQLIILLIDCGWKIKRDMTRQHGFPQIFVVAKRNGLDNLCSTEMQRHKTNNEPRWLGELSNRIVSHPIFGQKTAEWKIVRLEIF